jgi:hypothetical protein
MHQNNPNKRFLPYVQHIPFSDGLRASRKAKRSCSRKAKLPRVSAMTYAGPSPPIPVSSGIGASRLARLWRSPRSIWSAWRVALRNTERREPRVMAAVSRGSSQWTCSSDRRKLVASLVLGSRETGTIGVTLLHYENERVLDSARMEVRREGTIIADVCPNRAPCSYSHALFCHGLRLPDSLRCGKDYPTAVYPLIPRNA